VKKVLFILLAVVLALSLGIVGCASPAEEEEEKPEIKNPDTFVCASVYDAATLDPACAYDSFSESWTSSIYDPLIYWDGESFDSFVPILATEWNISEDGKTYRFKIREGVKFHNGDDLTPEDVEYTFERGMVIDYGGGPQWMIFEALFGPGIASSRTDGGLIPLDEIKSKVEVDGQWVQFNLAAPYPPFLHILCRGWAGIIDKKWCIEQGDWDGTEASYEELNNPPAGGTALNAIENGAGPWKLERWEPGAEIDLVRNDNYWREPAKLKRVVYKLIDEWTTRKLMLIAGDADCVAVPTDHYQDLEGVSGLTVYKDLKTLFNDAMFFQFDIDPESTFIGSGQLDGNGIPPDFFQDIDVRQGFAYAFDWETFIRDALNGEGFQIGSPIVEGIPYYDPNAPRYTLDLQKAEEHLKKAWGGEVWEKGFTFTLGYRSGFLEGKTACEILQQNLLQINPNFTIRIQAMLASTLLESMYMGLVPMFQMGWIPDYPDPHNYVIPFMASFGVFSSWQHYNNPEVDQLIIEGISTTNSAERESIYRQLDQIYYEDVPSFQLYQHVERRYFRDWVTGFYYNPIIPNYFGNFYALDKGYEE
jgi:peptide/nickel transport system substrate-binding protein